jgi:hypothetical protein
MSQGSVARKRYKAMDHLGDLGALGEDCTMGHQNKRPANRKHMSSKLCTQWERMPN